MQEGGNIHRNKKIIHGIFWKWKALLKTSVTEVRRKILFLKTKPINLLRGISENKASQTPTLNCLDTLESFRSADHTMIPIFPQWEVLERMIGQLDFNYPASYLLCMVASRLCMVASLFSPSGKCWGRERLSNWISMYLILLLSMEISCHQRSPLYPFRTHAHSDPTMHADVCKSGKIAIGHFGRRLSEVYG